MLEDELKNDLLKLKKERDEWESKFNDLQGMRNRDRQQHESEIINLEDKFDRIAKR